MKLNHTGRHLLGFLSFRRLVLGLALSAFLLPCSCELEELIFKVAFRLRHIDVQGVCPNKKPGGCGRGNGRMVEMVKVQVWQALCAA